MAEKKGLGVGLSALLGLDEDNDDAILSLPITRLEPRVDQPRTVFDEEALEELAQSVREYGVIQPITVRRIDADTHQIIAGERRWRAARMAGLTEVPVRVIEADDRLTAEIALVENLQREDLGPLEEAKGYKALIEGFGLTQEEAAKRVGKSRPAVTNALRLLTLAEPVAVMLENKELSAGHARAIAALEGEELQLNAAEAAVKKELSVRRTEALVKTLGRKAAEDAQKPEETEGLRVDYMAEVGKTLEKHLGRRVSLSERGKTGKISLEYYGADDRERLIEALSKLKIEV